MTDAIDPKGTDWTQDEIDLAVASYFSMWNKTLAGEKPVKMRYYEAFDAATRRGIKSIEWKCRNISAVLERLGLPWLSGLAPSPHFQGGLVSAVETHVQQFWNQDSFVPAIGSQGGIAAPIILFPEAVPPIEGALTSESPELERLARKFDPALRDFRNRQTGLAGEKLVYFSEKARLSAAGREDLAKRVEWVSQEQGDGAGYDIKSFEVDGSERFYEVKTTIGHRRTPFFLSRNERDFAEEAADRFRIFRLYELGKTPRSFLIAPPLESSLILEPTAYRASFG